MAKLENDAVALAAELRRAIAGLKTDAGGVQSGVVTKVGDGVAWIHGLRGCGYGEMLEVEGTDGQPIAAFALNLMEDEIGAVILGNDRFARAGAGVNLRGRALSIPVGPELVGRVVDPLGEPLDGKGPVKAKQTGLIERAAPDVIERQNISEPLMTGIAAIDTMVPIGRGQRELIIGDRQTGKTAVVVDAMINQARQKTDVISIYVAVGQKNARIARLLERLKSEGVMDRAIVVVAAASDPAPLQYLAPYAGCAIGEWFRDNSRHALVIYDDLSKHAVAYRQMSLLLRRPPGREAYPGDVFYLHSRLLERAAKLSDELGGGSLTALPIIETQAGDISAYIPTNVISITDGQIYLETDLFYQGIRPAVSVGVSVSRVGSAAQTAALKSVSKGLRLGLAQYRELAAFAQFSSDLDPDTKQRLARGVLLTEILKQPQYSPRSVWQQTAALLAATSGALDAVAQNQVGPAQEALLKRLEKKHPKIVKKIAAGQQPSESAQKTIQREAEQIAKEYGGEN